MDEKAKIILLLIAAILIAGAVRGFWPKIEKAVYSVESEASNNTGKDFDWFSQKALEMEEEAQFKTFVHPVYRFSFDYPVDWSVDAFFEEDQETLLVQGPETGIAVFIYPFDEPGPLTKKRVLEDVPDIKMENEIALKIGGIDALGFDGNERDFGPSKEIWFVYNNFLYQLAAVAGSGEVLYLMTETWKFQ